MEMCCFGLGFAKGIWYLCAHVNLFLLTIITCFSIIASITGAVEAINFISASSIVTWVRTAVISIYNHAHNPVIIERKIRTYMQ